MLVPPRGADARLGPLEELEREVVPPVADPRGDREGKFDKDSAGESATVDMWTGGGSRYYRD